MKILHVYKDFDPPIRGGIERHMAMMCQFQRQWADVEALVCSRTPWTRVVERDGTKVTEAGEWGRFQNAPLAPGFPWHLRRLAGDVVVIHSPNPTAELAWLLARPRGALVVRYHSDVVRQASAMRFYKPFLMQFLMQAAIILPTSQPYVDTSSVLQAVRASRPDRTGRPDRSRGPELEVVPLGIPFRDFQSPDAGRVKAVRDRYGRYVFFCGRHRYYKGLEHLVRAAPAIRAKVVIAGDGPEQPRLEALAAELGVEVSFPGPLEQEDLVAHLHGCETFVFPSVARSEAFGLSMLEAHAAGKPVVATRLGTGVEWVNLDQVTGLNVRPADPVALAEAVNALLDTPDRARAMGETARDRVAHRFDVEKVARTEFELYRKAYEWTSTGT